MIKTILQVFVSPMGKRFLWVLFGIIFYISGESFLLWLLEPENFTGGYRWFFAAVFPVLFPLSFFVNKRLGCATGACMAGQCKLPDDRSLKEDDNFMMGTGQMP